jgi:hypothetical protein
MQRLGANVVSQVTAARRHAAPGEADRPGQGQLDAYSNGEIDAVYIAYTRFINTMKQEPVIEQLLPLGRRGCRRSAREYSWDYLYEPDAQSVLDELLLRYVEALIYQAVAENMASEQSARMVAMKSASDNAKKVIDELQLSTTRRGRRRSPRNSARSSAARRPSDAPPRTVATEQDRIQRNEGPDMQQGTIVQCIGAVVDIQFPRDAMPHVYDALMLEDAGNSWPRRA